MLNNGSRLADLLPHTSFVPFSAYKARSATVLWSNRHCPAPVPLADCDYFIPLAGDPDCVVLSQPKRYFGERYGGMGLGRNGGGVRCGYDGAVQIKGIGQNPLVGAHRNFFHSYGGAALSESILDALWGEVCHVALPYGAVRVHGILETGTEVPVKFPKTGKSKTTRRTLTVREPALRPAHFLRAVFFAPKASPSAPMTDAQRVENAIRCMGQTLDLVLRRGPQPASPDAGIAFRQVNSGLFEVYRRFACQIAAARARRIMHGSLTPSNMALTGEWLDFGSISAVSDYGRIIVPRGAPDFMHEEQTLRPALDDLVFYLNKYSGLPKHGWVFEADPIWSYFRTILEERVRVEFLQLTGIPEDDLRDIDEQIKDRLFNSLRAIFRAGNASPFTILVDDNDYVPVMPGMMGTYHLPTILAKTAWARSAGDLCTELADDLADLALRREFVAAYFDLRAAFLAGVDAATSGAARTFVALNCVRRNILVPELYRTVLYPDIDALVESGGDVPAFIAERVRTAAFVYPPVVEGRFSAGPWFGAAATLDVRHGVLINGEKVSVEGAAHRLGQNVFGADFQKRMVDYAA